MNITSNVGRVGRVTCQKPGGGHMSKTGVGSNVIHILHRAQYKQFLAT